MANCVQIYFCDADLQDEQPEYQRSALNSICSMSTCTGWRGRIWCGSCGNLGDAAWKI